MEDNYFSDLYGNYDFWFTLNVFSYPRKDPTLGYEYLTWMLEPAPKHYLTGMVYLPRYK